MQLLHRAYNFHKPPVKLPIFKIFLLFHKFKKIICIIVYGIFSEILGILKDLIVIIII